MIIDGRDIGSIVFPKASLKVFLTASVECRAERRVQQMMGKKPLSSNAIRKLPLYQEVYVSIVSRDKRDSQRSLAPLVKAKDAFVIETSSLSKEQAEEVFTKKVLETYTQ